MIKKSIILLVSVCACVVFYAHSVLKNQHRIRAESIISILENYQKANSQYPENLSEVLNATTNEEALRKESLCDYGNMNGLNGKGYCYYTQFRAGDYSLLVGSSTLGWVRYSSANNTWSDDDGTN